MSSSVARGRCASWQRSDERAEPQPIVRAQQREGQELPQRAHREQPAVVVEADADRAEAEAVAEAELVARPMHAVVGRQNHVVEAVDAVAVEVEGADAARRGRSSARTTTTGTPCLGEAERRGHAEDAAADDADGGRSRCADRALPRGRLPRHQAPVAGHRRRRSASCSRRSGGEPSRSTGTSSTRAPSASELREDLGLAGEAALADQVVAVVLDRRAAAIDAR